jgi:hypothetical protein
VLRNRFSSSLISLQKVTINKLHNFCEKASFMKIPNTLQRQQRSGDLERHFKGRLRAESFITLHFIRLQV